MVAASAVAARLSAAVVVAVAVIAARLGVAVVVAVAVIATRLGVAVIVAVAVVVARTRATISRAFGTNGTVVIARTIAAVEVTTVASHTVVMHGRTMTYEGRGSVVGAVCPDAAVPGVVARGAAVVEVGAVVAIPKGEVPGMVTANDGAIEVVGRTIEAPLPIEKDVAEVGVAVVPIVVEGIAGANVHQVFEIDLINLVVLFGSEVEFVSHLVGKIVSVLLRFAEAHTKR